MDIQMTALAGTLTLMADYLYLKHNTYYYVYSWLFSALLLVIPIFRGRVSRWPYDPDDFRKKNKSMYLAVESVEWKFAWVKVTKYIYTCSSDLCIHRFNEAPITSTEILIALVNTLSLSVARNKHLILPRRQSHKSPRHQAGIQDYPRAKERPKQTVTAAEQLFLLSLLSLNRAHSCQLQYSYYCGKHRKSKKVL